MSASNLLRLAAIDPSRVALSIAGMAVHQAERVTRRLGGMVTLPPPPKVGMTREERAMDLVAQSEVYRAAWYLAQWAKTGSGLDAAMAVALLAEVRKDLGSPLAAWPPELAGARRAVELVLLATEVRLAVSEGRPVTATELATLASVDERTIRAAVQGGTLRPMSPGRPMRFAPEAASAYLCARGGMGVAPTSAEEQQA
jgi:hypothetical protein